MGKGGMFDVACLKDGELLGGIGCGKYFSNSYRLYLKRDGITSRQIVRLVPYKA